MCAELRGNFQAILLCPSQGLPWCPLPPGKGKGRTKLKKQLEVSVLHTAGEGGVRALSSSVPPSIPYISPNFPAT